MKKCLTFNNHQTLQLQLKCMRLEMKQQENGMISDTKNYVKSIPKNIMLGNKNKTLNHKAVANPIGRILAKGINGTLLNKQGFLTKIIAGFFIKKVSKKLENKLLKT
ncbi:MAG: hypothetical protein V4546_09670 [Bacteroidota bacterium]